MSIHISRNARRLSLENAHMVLSERDGCWKCVHSKVQGAITHKLYCEVNRREVNKNDICIKLFREERYVPT